MLKNATISSKLSIMVITLMAPTLILTYLFIASTDKDVVFAQKEIQGNIYFSALSDEMNALIDLSQSSGNKSH